LIALAAILIARLMWLWLRSDAHSFPKLFAATLTATLVFNIYVPIYDLTLLVIPAWLLLESEIDHPPLLLLTPLYLAPSFSPALADFAPLQILTPLLIAFVIVQLVRLRKKEGTPRSVPVLA